MPLITHVKFQINQVILTLFSGVWEKIPPVAEKVLKCHRQRGQILLFEDLLHPLERYITSAFRKSMLDMPFPESV